METKKFILAILLLLLFAQCKKETPAPNVVLREPFRNIVDSILKDKHYDNIELHINKVFMSYYVILLYGGKVPMSEQPNMWNAQIDDKNIAVYAGIENFLKMPRKKTKPLDEQAIAQGDLWLIKLKAVGVRGLLLKPDVRKVSSEVCSPFKATLPYLTPEELTVRYAEHVIDSIFPILDSEGKPMVSLDY